MKPCRKCGASERYADTRCIPCTRRRNRQDLRRYRAEKRVWTLNEAVKPRCPTCGRTILCKPANWLDVT